MVGDSSTITNQYYSSTTSTGGTLETQGVHRYIHIHTQKITHAHISNIFNVTLSWQEQMTGTITLAFLCKSKAYGRELASSGTRPARHRWQYFGVLRCQSRGSLVFLATLSKKKNKEAQRWMSKRSGICDGKGQQKHDYL